ncbi:hypothetical protein [Croceicoccus naphthovorans]|uniref:hypothetical protein n=1 Tax=Croceicoccus naphthovorans TaxID=1348774 RepID=UPI00069D0795|nr:hypothetical protein [Croceicoccus naphthovorans]MBB3989358.1 hypothetical protein [Croceicoccus naphthovorans]
MASEHFHEIKAFGADQLDSALRSVLAQDERVLWKGRPDAFLDFSAFLIWIFALPWTAFSVFWVYSAWSMTKVNPADGIGVQTAALLFPAFGLPFVLIGLVMLAVPFFALTMPGRTLHAVTDKRIVRIVGGRKTSLRAVPGDRVTNIRIRDRKDGYGDLIVEYDRTVKELPAGARSQLANRRRHVFRHLPNVRAAARAAERMRINYAASSPSAVRDK